MTAAPDSHLHHNLRRELRWPAGAEAGQREQLPMFGSNATASGEITHGVWINAVPSVIFPFLTCPARMRTWLAPVVEFNPRVGRQFLMTDFNGLWIEGRIVEVVSDTRVTFTWGGSDGLKPGQSIVKFALTAAAGGTIVRVCHSRLPDLAGDLHRFAWKQAGLARLKAVIEGGTPGGTFLGRLPTRVNWHRARPACQEQPESGECAGQ